MQMVAQSGFLKLKSLIRDLEWVALECGIDGTRRVIDLDRHEFAIPRMSAIFGGADHLPECRPLIILLILDKSRYRIVNAGKSLSAGNEFEYRLFQLRILEQHSKRVVEAERIELFDLAGAKHLDIVAENSLVAGTRAH